MRISKFEGCQMKERQKTYQNKYLFEFLNNIHIPKNDVLFNEMCVFYHIFKLEYMEPCLH